MKMGRFLRQLFEKQKGDVVYGPQCRAAYL